jgi:Domain of unknown function (DUF4296)
MKKNVLIILLTTCSLLACKHNATIIPPQQMKLIMWDMVTADEWLKIAAKSDSNIVATKQNTSLYNKVFILHKTTKETFYNSYKFYQTHPNEMKLLLDSLSVYAIKKRDTITNHLK